MNSAADAPYWAAVVAAELKQVAGNTSVGDRNIQLFRSTCTIFGIVKGGLGTRAVAEDLLIEAATDSGYAIDEPQQMMATLASAWRAATPRDLSKRKQPSSAPTNANGTSAHMQPISLEVGSAPIAEQAEKILEAFALHNGGEPRLFKMNTVITRLHRDDLGTRLEPLDKDALHYEIDRVAHFKQKSVHKNVPDAIVSNIAGSPDYNLPVIRGVKHAPYFDADGRLVDGPGYDAATGYLLELPPGLVIPTVPSHPTYDDLSKALCYLMEVIFDFPFRDRASKRTYLAMLLLPFCRDLINGPTPIHLIGKPAPGNGAGLAVNCFAMISTGEEAVIQSEAESAAEFRKNLTAFLMTGAPYYFLDNLHQSLDDPAFAAALTGGFWRDRVLGKSQLVNMPIRNTWIVAGNNPVLSEELARRSVLIWLDAQMADPCSRNKFRHPQLIEYVRLNRGRLIWACLTLIQAWAAEEHIAWGPAPDCYGVGDPEHLDKFLAKAQERGLRVTVRRRVPGPARLASFESWSRTMSGILKGAGVRGLLANHAKLKERTSDATAAMREFVNAWFATHGHGDVQIGSFTKGGQADNYSMVPAPGTLVELLHANRGSIDLGFNGRQESMWQTRMGATLSSVVDRVFQISGATTATIEVRVAKSRRSGGVVYRLERLP